MPAAVGSCFSSLYDGLFTCQQDPLYGLPLKKINNKQRNMFYKRFQRVTNDLSQAPRVGLQDGSILLLWRFTEQVGCTCVVIFWDVASGTDIVHCTTEGLHFSVSNCFTHTHHPQPCYHPDIQFE